METHYPDDVLPSQWMDQMRPAFTDVPERRLLIALLFDVIRVLHGGGIKQRAEISAWIRGTNNARIPFRLLCEALEIEPTCLARRLLQGEVARVSRFRAQGDSRKTAPSAAVDEPAAAVDDVAVASRDRAARVSREHVARASSDRGARASSDRGASASSDDGASGSLDDVARASSDRGASTSLDDVANASLDEFASDSIDDVEDDQTAAVG